MGSGWIFIPLNECKRSTSSSTIDIFHQPALFESGLFFTSWCKSCSRHNRLGERSVTVCNDSRRDMIVLATERVETARPRHTHSQPMRGQCPGHVITLDQ